MMLLIYYFLSAAILPAMCVYGGTQGYKEVLTKSILFYETQRSGKLPLNKRIKWRGDSALDDGKDVQLDLTGGWYTNGSHMKFNFPMAFSVTLLAWGMYQNRRAYEYILEWNNALDSIKWPLDYFIKCHPNHFEFYGQIGNSKVDHDYWGRPEDMNMPRPAYKVTPFKPGSDITGEAAAAMAAGALIFRPFDSAYSDKLLSHSKELYIFAKTFKGFYTNAIPDALRHFPSTNYADELAWAAAWLYKMTGEMHYLDEAKEHFQKLTIIKPFSWEDKSIGAALLIYEADRDHTSSKTFIKSFVRHWLEDVHYTPKGLAYHSMPGSNMYAANAAFALQIAASLGIRPKECERFAKTQIAYMLGDNGRSYQTGFGEKPPIRPHHRAASCPNLPAKCDWNAYNQRGPNPQLLIGALVGGPDRLDWYQDVRPSWLYNEVAVYYNAGFQSAIAGLLMQSLRHQDDTKTE